MLRRRSGQARAAPEPGAEDLWEQEMERLRGSRAPVRTLPYAMVDRRLVRQLREPEGAQTSSWQRWQRRRSAAERRLAEAAQRLARGFGLWEGALYEIGGLFGTGIQSYFTFLRFLLMLNLLTLLLTSSFVLLPLVWLRPPDPSPALNFTLQCPGGPEPQTGAFYFYDQLWDILTGRAFNNTYLFYGAYRAGPESSSTYSIRLAYLLSPLASLLLCFCGTLQRMVKGLPQKLFLGQDYRSPLSAKVFSSWDFCLRGQDAVTIKKHEISNEFKVELEEGQRFLLMQQQTRAQRAWHLLSYLWVNVLIGLLVVGAVSAIFQATKYSQDNKESLFVLLQYLPPGVISLVNFLGPLLFVFLVQLGNYSPNTEVNLTLIWCVVLKLASLGMFSFSLGQTVLCLGGNKTSLLGEPGGGGAVQAERLQLPAHGGLHLPHQSAPEAAGGAILRPVLGLVGPGGVPGAQERAGHRGGADGHLDGPLLLPPAAPAQQRLHIPHLLHQEAGAHPGPASGHRAPGLCGQQHPLLLGLRPLRQLLGPLAGGPGAGGPPAATPWPASPPLPGLPRLQLSPPHPAQPCPDRVRLPVSGQGQGHPGAPEAAGMASPGEVAPGGGPVAAAARAGPR
ncbi:transmembrane channel-like protein 8 isoform X5 [Sturnira hondurensis]|uniref:transmembrane channel-like protein 8 isoform X5 n=1 Tax=Sturnira hondurensis TaxID=192404 RepID=UPI00187AB086|nr:transmembrane channel-like protein 8 isoform X5 [Sturnira hondurensis]